MARSTKIAILVVLALAAIVLAYFLRAVFMPLLVALLLAYILNPVLNLLEERKVPRMASIVGVYVVLAGLLLGTVFLAVPAAVGEATEFVREVSRPESKARKLVDAAEVRLRAWLKIDDKDALWKPLLEKIKGHETEVAQAGGRIALDAIRFLTTTLSGLVTLVSFVALVPIYLFFLMKNMNPWWTRFTHAIPRAYRDPTLRTLGRIHAANASFFRGQITISAIEGLIVFVGLWIFGVKLSFLFGLLYAVLSLVPYLGVVVGFAVTELFVLADTGTFGSTFFLVAGLFVAVQILEGALLQPMILGKETGLHPIAIILALLLCGELFGLFGLLIGVPLAATAKILLEDYVWPMFQEVADLTRIRPKPEP